MLDEGHTLGSRVRLTNKLEMQIYLNFFAQWLLTSTPTPNTPNSQVAHLHHMIKFLHEEAYGLYKTLWEYGIMQPLEVEMKDMCALYNSFKCV